MPRISAVTILCACLFALSACLLGGKDDPHGSEVENEILGATIYLADGKPAAGAVVRIFPVDHNPQAAPKLSASQNLAYSTLTDSKGHYRVDSLPRGEYNILSDLEGEVAYQDSVFLSPKSGLIRSDTLRDPGGITGRVVLQANHDTRSVTVQVLGTNQFANVDEEGWFTLPGLAQGKYRARLVTTVPEYTALFANVEIRAGKSDTLAQPLRPVYTGIPIVEGLRAEYDTANGIAILRWNPVKYGAFAEYLIYRKRAGDVAPAVTALDATRDTVYRDTLYRNGIPVYGNGFPPTGGFEDVFDVRGFAGAAFEYRVAVRNKSQDPGKTYGSVRVDAVDPAVTYTSMEIRSEGVGEGRASIGDTMSFILVYSNPSRRIGNLEWSVSGSDRPVRSIDTDARAGRDTLKLSWNEPSTRQITARLTDDLGRAWTASASITIFQDPPVPQIAPVGRVSPNDTVRLRGSALQDFGRIVKWEWNIGGAGFRETSGPDTFFVAPTTLARISCVLRVTDDDGNVEDEGIDIDMVADIPKADAGGQELIFVSDTLRLHGVGKDETGRIVSYHWLAPGAGSFIAVSGGDTAMPAPSVPGTYGYVLKVIDDDGNEDIDTLNAIVMPRLDFVQIPGGSFVKSSGVQVTVAPFRILATELSWGQYYLVMGRKAGKGDPDWNLPVTRVRIDDIGELCNRLSLRLGRNPAYTVQPGSGFKRIPGNGVRLPHAHEWEYAARAGNGDTYWETVSADSLDEHTWYSENSAGRLQPVRGKAPNAFGLYDMNGNASELIDRGTVQGVVPPYVSLGSSVEEDYRDRQKLLDAFKREFGLNYLDGAIGFRLALPL